MSWDSVLKNTWEEEAREFLEEYASDTLDAVDRMSLELQKVTEEKIQMVKDMVQRINDNIHLPYESREDLLMKSKRWLDTIKKVFNETISKIKEFEVFVSKESKNLYKEQQGYLWEETKEEIER